MENFLKQIPLFSELTDSELEYLKQMMTERIFKKQTYIFMEGSKREAVYFIQTGTVKVFKVDEAGNEQGICLLKAGNMFPHVGFFDDSSYPATAEVVEEGKLLIVKVEDFERFLLENPKVAMKVMKTMGQKTIELQQRLQDLISGDVYKRVTSLLLRFARESGEERENGVFIAMPISNKEIANMIGTTRESISRTLNHYRKLHLIDIEKEGIMIRDIAKLEKLR
ncbi:MAG TPA: Crp/Fnr family transcriptional regulator [Bacilli bacterium]|nr:Crp/Fnr family transcriptional regulator [Bacilli bacterium]